LDAIRHHLAVLLRPRKYAREMEAEREFHLELETMQQRYIGTEARAAELAARRHFGNVTYYGEETRRMTSLRFVDALVQDLRYAFRTLRKSPGFTIAAIVTLALGIGATTAVFSLVNALLLRPLPAVQPDELVAVNEQRFGMTSNWMGQAQVPYNRFLAYREGTHEAFSGLAAQREVTFSSRAGSEPASAVSGEIVSENFFDVLGLRPAAGRFFTSDDEPVAVLSHRFWEAHFSRDPDAIGSTIYLDSRPYTIAGVAPPGFGGTVALRAFDVWVPARAALADAEGGSHSWVAMFGRLRSDVDPARAASIADAVAKRVPPDEPQSRVLGARLDPMTTVPEYARRDLTRFLGLLFAAGTLVLLIAGANIAGMLLARAVARRREIAVRLAIGAGRGRLVRQLLTESLLVFLLGGAGGVFLAVWLARLLAVWGPGLPTGAVLDLTPDVRVLGFALTLAAVTGIIFGLAPAVRASRAELVPALKDGAGRGSRSARGRSTFVAAQLALSVVLLVAAGLFVRTLRSALAVDPGFDPDGVVIASINLAPSGYDEARGRAFYTSLVQRMHAIPGVEDVGLAQTVLLSGGVGGSDIESAEPGPQGRMTTNAWLDVVDPGYFRTLHIPLVAGRPLSEADDAGSGPVLVVNQELARRLWPGQSPLGQHIRSFDRDWEVVGVTRDGKYSTINEDVPAFMFLPSAQYYSPWMTLHVRAHMPAAQVIRAMQNQVRALDPNVAVADAKPLTDAIGATLFQQRFAAQLIGIFGAVGLLLAAIGIYGVLAYLVAQRTREFGIRLALGARNGDVLRLVLRRAARLIVIGTGLGLATAAATTRILSGLLYGISPLDPVTFAVAPLVLAAVALAASYIPARRATRVDPITALRAE
jgi:predicted permease